jgi:hypothetical protein
MVLSGALPLSVHSVTNPLSKVPEEEATESRSQCQSQSYFTADGQSFSKSWCRAQSGTFDQRSFFFFFLKVSVLSFEGALSDERSGLSFVSLCQYSIQ